MLHINYICLNMAYDICSLLNLMLLQHILCHSLMPNVFHFRCSLPYCVSHQWNSNAFTFSTVDGCSLVFSTIVSTKMTKVHHSRLWHRKQFSFKQVRERFRAISFAYKMHFCQQNSFINALIEVMRFRPRYVHGNNI